MNKHFLLISLEMETEDTLGETQELLPADIECALQEYKAKVTGVKWDRDAALLATKDNRSEFEILNPRPSRCVSLDVATICEKYKIQLPKQKHGAPEWKVPKEPCRGYVNGIFSMRGLLVLTNGIKAFIVKEHDQNKWCDIHHDFFIADDIETVPAEYRYKKAKKEPGESVPLTSLMEFEL